MPSVQHRSKYIGVRRGSPLDLLGSGFLPLLQNYMGGGELEAVGM